MPKVNRNFTAGKMNKDVDERILPDGEYIDATNIRISSSTSGSDVGTVTNTMGNQKITTLKYIDGTPLTNEAICIGTVEDSANEIIYWFVHDAAFPGGKLDMIVSYNTSTTVLTYHVVSRSVLNFNRQRLITGINIIDNLIFFTDDYNPPRFINRKKSYPVPIGMVDQITAESLLVIKKPPVESPKIRLIKVGGQDKFLDERFISFAYRYKYENGEYSAISQFSEPAFQPSQFQISVNSFLNDGMTNLYNGAVITYNTGGPLVVGIDLLFKETHNNIIKVIEKLDKKKLGIPDNVSNSYTFTNSKVFTVLPESELLRLYDNVPLQAKAQTIMGNRLMYGNYAEGYDMLTNDNVDVKLEYEAKLLSETVGNTELVDSTSASNYEFEYFLSIPNSIVSIDLTGISLIEGSSITIELRISHDSFKGNTTDPTQKSENIPLTFSFVLPRNYSSVYALATSTEFKSAVGTLINIQTVANSCNGTTFTDQFNCSLPNTLGSLYKHESGITAAGQPITIISSPGSNSIGFQIPTMRYVNNPVNHTLWSHEYFQVIFAEAYYQLIGSPKSLHSNRGYEVGIVYMDDFGRSTTALVSPRNTVHVPCSASDTKNSIRVTIPKTQSPPGWATRYKFVIKPDKEKYETIFSYIYFIDPETNYAYFLLEGESARKVEVGDRLIVKSDTTGAVNTCAYATVLEKEAKQENFIDVPSIINPGTNIPIPSGVYMKINPNNFSVVSDELSIISPGQVVSYTDDDYKAPILYYEMNKQNAAGNWVDYSVPAGSRIKISIRFERRGHGDGNGSCERRNYTLEKVLISSANYDNMKEWWDGDNVSVVLNDGIQDIGGNQCEAKNEYISTFATSLTDIPMGTNNLCTNYYRFYRDATTNKLVLMITGTIACGGWNRLRQRSTVTATIDVFRSGEVVTFETEPINALPDVFYENDLSLPIVNGFHLGNVQNQSETDPAIIDTKFFNCYTFGNGIESYKIKDSIVGHPLSLGHKVTSVSAQDYKRVRRFADITYSGVYNFETNVNKLNEFNLGLLNYKYLEVMFGPIYILDGRQTDVLVLQEDKISYVLAGKNLLSDAAAGGAITSVPEVLGTQIARTEKYGISFNPESYTQWGAMRFFTDVKRGAVLQITGDGYNSDKLDVISETGMRTWFRSEFITGFNTQKIGGFDPYHKEYLICSNSSSLPPQPQSATSFDCGAGQFFTIPNGQTKEYTVSFGQEVGQVTVSYSLASVGTFQINVIYNGVTNTTGVVSSSGNISFNKSLNTVNTATIQIIPVSADLEITVTPSCPAVSSVTLVLVCLTSVSDNGQFIHNEYRYKNGEYISPLQSNFVEFVDAEAGPAVSQFDIITGNIGTGSFPIPGASMEIISNRHEIDTFVFDESSDKLRFLKTNAIYNNTPEDIAALVAASTDVSYTFADSVASGSFSVPSTGNRLYLIWDYRNSVSKKLCYSSISNIDACCNCGYQSMIGAVGDFEIVGSDAQFFVTKVMSAGAGQFNLTGSQAYFTKAFRIVAETGNFVITGVKAGIVKSLVAEPGSFTINAADATITKTFPVTLCMSTVSTFDACCGCSDTATLGQCFQYKNFTPNDWVGDYQACDGTWYYGVTVGAGNFICAVNNTPYTPYGTNLAKQGSCTI